MFCFCSLRRAFFAAVGALVLSVLSSISAAQPVLTDPSLEAVPFLTGLNQPIGIVWMDSTEALVIEKATGKVMRFVGGVNMGTALDLAVNSASERGLLSICLHPSFAKNGFVYLFWSQSSTGIDTTSATEIDLLGNRIDRFHWDGATLTFDRNILQMRGFQLDAGQPARGNHNGGVVRFGPDGKLYAIAGDRGRRGYLQNNFMGPVPDDPFGGPAPDAAHTSGVIYRINADGSAPTDNPFYHTTPYPSMDIVYGFGVRNGFGLAFDPMTGKLWTQENGDDSFDEMNLVGPGFNGGWIQFMGPLSRIADYKLIETTLTGGLQQLRWPPTNIASHFLLGYKRLWNLKGSHYADPKFSWKFAVAPAGIEFVNSADLGPKYQGDMLVGAARTNLANGYLMRFNMNGARDGFDLTDPRLADLVADNAFKFDPVESESLMIGSGFGIVVSLVNGPGGMYAVSLDQGSIYLIRAH